MSPGLTRRPFRVIGGPAPSEPASTGGRQSPPKAPAPATSSLPLLDRVFPPEQCEDWWATVWLAGEPPFRSPMAGPMQTCGGRPTGWDLP